MPNGHQSWVALWLLALITASACGGSGGSAASPPRGTDLAASDSESESVNVPPYTGHGPEEIPHYATREFTSEERVLLRTKFGIEDPHRLYVSDSTEDGLLKYDTQWKTCATCYVNTYRVGFISVRRPGESWEAVERRVRTTPLRNFPQAARRASSASLAALDPAVQVLADQMLADAGRAGFLLHVRATYRSPEREAYLMAEGRGRTHTLTSLHLVWASAGHRCGRWESPKPFDTVPLECISPVGLSLSSWCFPHPRSARPELGLAARGDSRSEHRISDHRRSVGVRACL